MTAAARPAWLERSQSAILFLLHAGAIGMWTVSFGIVLKTHGLDRFIPFAYASGAISAFISPMFIGALADQKIAPTTILRWLAAGAAAMLALAFTAIERGWSPLWMLVFLQGHTLCATPTWGLTNSIVIARLRHPDREFGPIRAWGTFGWMAAGWFVSFILAADASTRSGFAAAATWAGLSIFTVLLPKIRPVVSRTPRTWRDIFGLQALDLLRDRNHRVVFLTAALFNAPLAAFYPYAPIHLRAVGVEYATAAMSLGQVSEIVAMLGLSWLLARVRLKWVFLAGIGFGVLRYGLFALDSKLWLIVGISLHGFAYALYFITLQIYFEQRIDPVFRARAQALLILLTNGFGNLAGYLGIGWWRHVCLVGDATRWPLFWLGLTAVTACVFLFFALAYRGIPDSSDTS